MAGLVDLAVTVKDRLTTNLAASFQAMSPEKWIRLVIIVGAYALVRPYLLKLGAKTQMKQHEKEAGEAEAEAALKAKGKISPNELRGHTGQKVDIPEDSDGEEEGAASAADWGKNARRRQRAMIKKMLDAEEKRLQELQEDDEDKDIQEFLTE